MTQNPQDRTIEEYKTLRAEILLLLNRELTLVSFTFTATAAILGFAFSQGISLLFLVPLLMLRLVLFQLNDSARSVARISAYIRIFLEPNDPGLNWETRMDDLRDALQSQPLPTYVGRTLRSLLSAGRLRSVGSMSWYYPGLRALRNPIFSTASSQIVAIVLGFISIFLALYYSLYPNSSYESVICVVVAGFWAIISAETYSQLHYVKSGDYEKYLESLWAAFER